MKILDKRYTLAKHKTRLYKKRNVDKITSIAIHHSLTLQGSSEAFARYHINHNGWPGIGYTYVINKNGIIDWCHDWNVKTAHVGNSNKYSLGICLVGDFRKEEPTEEQLQAAADLCMMLIDDIESIKEIKAHQDFPGYSWKECPAFDVMKITNRMKAFRK
jgi:N-acetyl-anhydromuramyl-L-alanine amidase AmpD